MSCSNFSRPGLNDLTLGGVGCLGGVLGGYFGLGDFMSWAYVRAFEVGQLLVPTWDDFGSEDPQVGSSSHLIPQSATQPPPLRS